MTQEIRAIQPFVQIQLKTISKNKYPLLREVNSFFK